MAGKVIIYPVLHHLGLVRLNELGARFPTVAAKLEGEQWCNEAERELLRVCRDDAPDVAAARGPGVGGQP